MPDFSLCFIFAISNGGDFFQNGGDFLENGGDFLENGVDFLKNLAAVFPCGGAVLEPVALVAFPVARNGTEYAPTSGCIPDGYRRQ